MIDTGMHQGTPWLYVKPSEEQGALSECMSALRLDPMAGLCRLAQAGGLIDCGVDVQVWAGARALGLCEGGESRSLGCSLSLVICAVIGQPLGLGQLVRASQGCLIAVQTYPKCLIQVCRFMEVQPVRSCSLLNAV